MENIKIVDVVFAFQNQELIKMLLSRAKFYKYELIKNAEKIERQLQEYAS